MPLERAHHPDLAVHVLHRLLGAERPLPDYLHGLAWARQGPGSARARTKPDLDGAGMLRRVVPPAQVGDAKLAPAQLFAGAIHPVWTMQESAPVCAFRGATREAAAHWSKLSPKPNQIPCRGFSTAGPAGNNGSLPAEILGSCSAWQVQAALIKSSSLTLAPAEPLCR